MLAVVPAVGGASLTLTGAAAQGAGGPAEVGRFLAPFEDTRASEGAEACRTDADGRKLCKPAGATVVALNDGKVLYWDALEGTENIDLSIVTEFGNESRNSRSRTIDLSGPEPIFGTPDPETGGANPDGNDSHPLSLPLPGSNTTVNDGDMFCADQVQLADGRIIAVGGTDYYNDPSIPGTDFGIVELEGLRNARIYDPATNQWAQSGSMHYGRWYPSLVTLPDGKIVVASGVSKLLKPLYPDRPFDSGTNVKQLEVYDPATGEWTVLPESANRSLPLFPRLHLLPNGHVCYDVAGQSFNPWFDHRLHPAPCEVPGGARRADKSTTLANWTVPLDYGGQPASVTGRVVYEPERGAVSARMRGPARPFASVAVQLAPGRVPALFLTNRGAEPVLVLGRDGEPFARVGPRGVEINRHSPTWADNARAQGQDLAVATAIVTRARHPTGRRSPAHRATPGSSSAACTTGSVRRGACSTATRPRCCARGRCRSSRTAGASTCAARRSGNRLAPRGSDLAGRNARIALWQQERAARR